MIEQFKEGMPFPNIPLYDERDDTVYMKKFLGKTVVIYFYPKDNTPGCTREACSFRDSYQKLLGKDVVLIGVSLDSSTSHRNFQKKYGLPFPLLTDKKKVLSKTLGFYGRNALFGLLWALERATVIIDRQGKIHKVFRHVQVDGHVEQVLLSLPN